MKFWKISFWLAVIAGILLIPAAYGTIIAVVGGGMSCQISIPWWMLCIKGSYVMLTMTGLGMLAVIAIVAIARHIRDIYKNPN